MKSFIYTRTEGKTPTDGSGTRYTVKVWRIKRNLPELLIEHTDAFVSEFQHVMIALEAAKALPRRAFARNQWGGYVHRSADSLRDSGFAVLTEL